MKNKIAIFMPSLRESGPQKCMINLAKGMIQKGYNVELVLAEKNGKLLDLVKNKINIVDLKCKRSIWESLPRLIKYIKTNNPEVLIAAPERANMILCLAKKMIKQNFKAIITVRNTLSRSFANSESWKNRILMPRIVRNLYPCADSIVSVSKGVADDLCKMININRNRINTIYNPVVTSEMYSKSKEEIYEDWYPSQNKKVIISVGRLSKQKNYELLIRAFSCLKDIDNKVLLILGDGDKRKRLESLVKELGIIDKVIMPGFVLNPYKFMLNASVFVLSSDWEGLGNVLIEALALGTPVVSTDCPSGPKEILDNGRFGKIVPMGNVELLSMAIEETLEKPGPLVTDDHIRQFSMDYAIERYIDLF